MVTFLAFAMALTLEICLVLEVVVFVSFLESHLLRTRATGNLVKYSGLLEGGHDSVTLIDAVVGRQFLVPATACGASTMVLHPAVPSWANLFKQIDACSGLSQMDGQLVEASDHQTQRVNYLRAQMPSQDQQLYGQIETQTRIQAMLETQLSHIWGVVSMLLVLHPAVPSWANLFKQIDACSGLSQMDGQSVEVSDHQTQRVNYLQTQLPSQDQQLYGQIETQTRIQAMLETQLSHIWGVVSMLLVLHPAAPSWANLFKQIHACSGLSQMDGQSVEVSDHQTQGVNYLQTQLPSQDQQLYGQIETQTRIQAMLETQLSHIWGVVSMRLREGGE